MPYFNWDELDLATRRYLCLLAGIHHSHAELSYGDFSTRAGVRDTDFKHRITVAGTRWCLAADGCAMPSHFAAAHRTWHGDNDLKRKEDLTPMRDAKFRQLVSGKWHYWGSYDDKFVPPISTSVPSQQFTGLRSESGQEIYEGDIGKLVLDNVLPQYAICLVEWCKKSASFRWSTKQLINIRDTGKEWPMAESGRFVIIGNVCENPDLILR